MPLRNDIPSGAIVSAIAEAHRAARDGLEDADKAVPAVTDFPASIFQMAEVAVPRDLFGRILRMIAALRPLDPAPC